MPFLLRVELPDVPGSLGRVASAIGEAGGDIEAIEIVEKTGDGTAVDDVLLEIAPGTMPDSIVSACSALDGVRVLWISRYTAGGNLFLDLEVVEELTIHPHEAHHRLLGMIPVCFRVDWAVWLSKDGDEVTLVDRTEAAPEIVAWADIDRPERLLDEDENLVLCGFPVGEAIFVLGRRGGPEFVDSELARIGHLVNLATSISQTAALAATAVVKPARPVQPPSAR